jgi:hypothetical protein
MFSNPTTSTRSGEYQPANNIKKAIYCGLGATALLILSMVAATGPANASQAASNTGAITRMNASVTVASAASTIIFVRASQSFTDTGVNLTQGQHVSITATGRARYSSGSPTVSAAGLRFTNPACTGAQYAGAAAIPFVAPGLPCYSLIGRIGNTPIIFEVGKSCTLVAPQNGELYLGFNDSYYGDNSGGFTAVITTGS